MRIKNSFVSNDVFEFLLSLIFWELFKNFIQLNILGFWRIFHSDTTILMLVFLYAFCANSIFRIGEEIIIADTAYSWFVVLSFTTLDTISWSVLDSFLVFALALTRFLFEFLVDRADNTSLIVFHCFFCALTFLFLQIILPIDSTFPANPFHPIVAV